MCMLGSPISNCNVHVGSRKYVHWSVLFISHPNSLASDSREFISSMCMLGKQIIIIKLHFHLSFSVVTPELMTSHPVALKSANPGCFL